MIVPMNIPTLQKVQRFEPPKLRRTIPNDWKIGPGMPEMPGSIWATHASGLRILMSTDVMDDGSRWLHVACSRTNRIPNWEELKLVKDAFIGRAHEAIHVLPKDEDFINLRPHCMHLWSPEP